VDSLGGARGGLCGAAGVGFVAEERYDGGWEWGCDGERWMSDETNAASRLSFGIAMKNVEPQSGCVKSQGKESINEGS
jgi:hypothetical protein